MTALPAYRTVSVRRAELPAGRRVLILSDIHGHAEALKKALRRAAFSREDTLVVVGDLLEKGTGSLAVIRTLMALSETRRVFTLMGNMDVFILSRLLSDDPEMRRSLMELAPKMKAWWGGCLLMEMCAELGVPLENGTDEKALFREIRTRFDRELSFMTGLPTILDTPRMTFVHGGLPHLRQSSGRRRPLLPQLRYPREPRHCGASCGSAPAPGGPGGMTPNDPDRRRKPPVRFSPQNVLDYGGNLWYSAFTCPRMGLFSCAHRQRQGGSPAFGPNSKRRCRFYGKERVPRQGHAPLQRVQAEKLQHGEEQEEHHRAA